MTDKPSRAAGRKARSTKSVKPVVPFAAPAEQSTAPDLASVLAQGAGAGTSMQVAEIRAPAIADAPFQTKSESSMTDSNKAAETINQAGDRVADQTRKMQDQFASASNEAAGRAQATMGDMNDRAREAMERSARFVEDMNDFNKGNIEALVESSKAAARHAEALSQQAAEYSRKSYEQASAAVKEMSSMKSPTDFFRLQSEFARQAFDQMVAESSRNSEAMLKAAGDVFQPLSNRFAVAAEKLKVGN